MDTDIKQQQNALRELARSAAVSMMSRASMLTHRGKQDLLIEAANKGNLKTIQGLMIRARKEDYLSKDIKSGVRFDADGIPTVIGYLMPRHGFLAMLGVGNGHPIGSNRTQLDFYNPVISAALPGMADVVANIAADLTLKVFSTESMFNSMEKYNSNI